MEGGRKGCAVLLGRFDLFFVDLFKSKFKLMNVLCMVSVFCLIYLVL